MKRTRELKRYSASATGPSNLVQFVVLGQKEKNKQEHLYADTSKLIILHRLR